MKKANNKIDKKDIFELIKNHREGRTWWMSDFYESFCKKFDLDFNDIEKNANKIRRELNKLVKSGDLKKNICGTGHGGKTLFNSTKMTLWTFSDNYLKNS